MEKKEYLRSFGRVKGHKLSDNQEKLIAEILPTIRPTTESLKSQKIWLEIGFGAGEHLIGLIEERGSNTNTAIIGCEPYINGAVKAVRYIRDNDVQNAFIYDGDARDLFEEIQEETIERCYILFPDPWPKKRHHKRRIISKLTIISLFKKLMPGGEIIMATDHAGYAEWINDELTDWKVHYEILHSAQECSEKAILTRYCKKALSQGISINFFVIKA